MRRGAKPAKSRKPPPKSANAGVRDVEKRLAESLRRETEALEQHAATAEILRVISAFPTDVQPVMDAIAQAAVRLCNAFDATVARRDGDRLLLVAHHGPIASRPIGDVLPLTREAFGGRSVLDGRIVQVADAQAPAAADEFPEGSEIARRMGFRTILSVPLIRDGVAIGAVLLRRSEAQPFSEQQIALLKTFADQAVIAIENVRLFVELKAAHSQATETLEQQTATSEILQVISRSPTDVQPVFETIIQNAVRLCDGFFGIAFRYDGHELSIVAHHNFSPRAVEMIARSYPAVPGPESMAGRAVLRREVIHISDVTTTGPDTGSRSQQLGLELGYRAFLAVPMLRDGEPIGVINVVRREPRAFTDKQIALVKTFADQAVIAVENVRLFKELQVRNRDLTESLDKQTATSEILRVIASSPTDAQPVFDTIVRNAVRLCDAIYGTVSRSDGVMIQSVAHYNLTPEQIEESQRTYPRPLSDPGGTTRAIRTGRVVRVADLETDVDLIPAVQMLRARGVRSLLIVPMLRQGKAIGTINVTHRQAGAFTNAHIELLRTFADQAVIAIENVRLLRELEERGRQLEAASQHKSEFLANMSHELRTPLNAVIGFAEVLTERMFGELNEKQEEYLKDIHASGIHLLSLINDILDLSKIEAGRMELELTEFDLPTALDSALTLVRERAGRRSTALETAVDQQIGEVRADERKIRQVVLNLLSNAIKFTPEGGRIEVRAVRVDGFIEVSVSDTGVGIAPEDQDAVFEEFRQVGASAAKQEGTGLGLALCRKFVELHGGKIGVTSEVGAGSTFTFTIPTPK